MELLEHNKVETSMYQLLELLLVQFLIKLLLEFLEPFDVIWNRLRNPNTGDKIDVKELVTELQKQTITAAEQHNQYG
ncbi:MAG TPA: hypothetical protein VFG77_00070 [Nitrososphaeraceae archaeon]|nr:hypothetical protein [Nitrososphaeraceae archaeon]